MVPLDPQMSHFWCAQFPGGIACGGPRGEGLEVSTRAPRHLTITAGRHVDGFGRGPGLERSAFRAGGKKLQKASGRTLEWGRTGGLGTPLGAHGMAAAGNHEVPGGHLFALDRFFGIAVYQGGLAIRNFHPCAPIYSDCRGKKNCPPLTPALCTASHRVSAPEASIWRESKVSTEGI